jgi:hypothetical protein
MSAQGQAAPAAETSVRDDLLSALSEVKQRAASSEGDGGAAAASPAPANDGTVKPDGGTPAPQADKPGTKPRAEDGRFTPAGAAKPADEAAAAAAAAAPAAQPVAPQASAVKAPDGWSAEMKAVFPGLDPKLQAEITRRETELTRKITSVDEDRTLGKKVREATAPYQAIMQAEGATLDTAFQSFLNYNYIMRQGSPQQKAAAILNVVRTWNVPLQQILQQPQGQSVALHPAIETLQQRLDRMEQQTQADARTRQLQADAESQAEIDAFANDPSHSHFETVKPLMGTLLTSGQAKSMQDAYEQACRAHPDIFQTLVTASAATQQAEAIKKAEAAKHAAGSVVGGPGGAIAPAPAPASTGSIRDDIVAAMAQVRGQRL